MSKIIHQIWFQGEENLPDDLQELKLTVVQHNPDFEIMYWDYDKITSFIAEKRPDWIEKWNTLTDEDQAFVKLTEVTRWLVLYEFGGFYLDRDIKVFRPLKGLYDRLNELNLACFPLEKVSKDRYIQIPIGYKLYSTVKKRYEYILQDSFVYSNPKNSFFNKFLDYGFTLKEKNVFESFSIWALTDFSKKFSQDIYLLKEQDVLYGNETYGYCMHYFVNGWIDEAEDKPWESTPKTLHNFQLYKI